MKLELLIYVTDLKRSMSFYGELLGFKVGIPYPNVGEATYVPVYAGKHKLMLCLARKENEKLHAMGLGGSGTQLFVEVKDVDGYWGRLKDKAKIIDEIENKSWGDREFTLADPDGYLLSFYQPI